MAENEIKLEPKLVGEITGQFFVPGYQRGYRWGEDEVTRLLEDINANGTQPYCLQPIVVKKNNDKYELIDGQQRLTTIYLIYKYIYDNINTIEQWSKNSDAILLHLHNEIKNC